MDWSLIGNIGFALSIAALLLLALASDRPR